MCTSNENQSWGFFFFVFAVVLSCGVVISMWVGILITVQHRIPLLLHSAVISMWVSLQGVCGWICVCTCLSSHPLCVNIVSSTLTFHACMMCATRRNEKYTSGNNKSEIAAANGGKICRWTIRAPQVRVCDLTAIHGHDFNCTPIKLSDTRSVNSKCHYFKIFCERNVTDSLLSSALFFYISSRNIWLFVCSLLSSTGCRAGC